jgi:hypothetical protein
VVLATKGEELMSNNAPSMAMFRSWKWIVGVIYIVLAVVLLVIGRISIFDAALLAGIGIILV